MDPATVFDAAKLITAGGATVYIAVQLVKAFGATTPRATVATSVAVSAALTVIYGLSNGLLDARNAFDLVIAAFAIAATGSGINAAANATVRG